MNRTDESATPGVEFGHVLAALRNLGGAAHCDAIITQIGGALRIAGQGRNQLREQVRRLLAEQEALDEAQVRRVFGAESNRWRLG